MEYYNLDLTIEKRVEGRHAIKGRSQTQGEAEGVLALDPSSPDLAAACSRIAADPTAPDGEALTQLGAQLWDGLFNANIRDLYRSCLGETQRDDGTGVRIRLCIDALEAAVLPWELLYDRSRDAFLATSTETPLTRYISLQEPIRNLQTTPPVKMLVVIPEASGLDVTPERDGIERALGDLGDAVAPTFLDRRVTRSAIREALMSGGYHVLHFIGHGEFQQDEGLLLINSEDDPSGVDRVSGRAFGGFFQDYPTMKLVVLNACQGAQVSSTRPLAGVAPQIVRRGVPAVVAMQYPIDDRAAVLFAREFYRKLCTGSDRGRVDAAVSHARNTLDSDHPGTLAFATPVLYMRSSAGVVFDLGRPDEKRALIPSARELGRLKDLKKTYTAETKLLKAIGDPAALAEIPANDKRVAEIDRRIRTRHLLVALLVSVPVLLASWLSLFNAPFFLRLDDRLEYLFVRAMDSLVPADFSDRIVLVLADGEAARGDATGETAMARRCQHADLIDGLADAGAAAIGFDLLFEQGYPPCDSKLAGAIGRARTSGTPVVVGVQHLEWVERTPHPRIAESLRGAVADGWGMVLGSPGERKLPLASAPPAMRSGPIEETEVGVVPSFSLRIAMLAKSAKPGSLHASLDPRARVIRLRDANRVVVEAIPVVDRFQSTIVHVPEAAQLTGREHPYRDVLAGAAQAGSLAAFKNSIVIVGYKSEADRWDIGRDRPLYGVHMQASAVSNLLEGDYVRPLTVWWHYIAIVVMAVVAVLLRTRFRRWRGARALAVVLVAYGALAIVLYSAGRIVLDFSYHVFALTFTYWLLGRLRSGLGARTEV
ncbi:MAG TPA: CHAT domain-containing protein [Vicinamibacterales bacterium]|jgi:CHASE2 domain-containing sensor protein